MRTPGGSQRAQVWEHFLNHARKINILHPALQENNAAVSPFHGLFNFGESLAQWLQLSLQQEHVQHGTYLPYTDSYYYHVSTVTLFMGIFSLKKHIVSVTPWRSITASEDNTLVCTLVKWLFHIDQNGLTAACWCKYGSGKSHGEPPFIPVCPCAAKNQMTKRKWV